MTTLSSLSLAHNMGITDTGLPSLAKLRNLTHLNLRYRAVGFSNVHAVSMLLN